MTDAMEFVRSDMALAIKHMAERLDQLAENQVRLIQYIESRTWTVEEIAKWQGCSSAALYASPWRLPRYGVADFGASPKKWMDITVRAWYSRPEIERKKEWEGMTAAERREVLGVEA